MAELEAMLLSSSSSTEDISTPVEEVLEVSSTEAPTFGAVVIDLATEGEEGQEKDGDMEEEGSVTLDGTPILNPRSYQTEMLEESLKRNIVVAMDTGSGKTLIAIMRIQAELDRCPPHKMIWFMAPTLELCTQQFQVLHKHLASTQIKFLSGNDKVNKWSNPGLWEAVLKGTRVIVCTHQILLDALTNGFVRLTNIALLVFDEAHGCVKSHAGAKIMSDFYAPDAAQNSEVPHVLGLSASPIMNSKLKSLETIEETLHAICRTPSRHRAELLLHVKMPQLCEVTYEPDCSEHTRSLSSFCKVYKEMDIYQDPYIVGLLKDPSEKAKQKLADVVPKRKTWCFQQMKAIFRTSLVILRELGSWAVDSYLSQILSLCSTISTDYTRSEFEPWTNAEKTHLCKIIQRVEAPRLSLIPSTQLHVVSDKVKQFIDALPRNNGFAGIVFVKQRATVAILAQLLSTHPDTSTSLRVGTGTYIPGGEVHAEVTFSMVGTSNRRSTNIADCIDVSHQKNTLERFRTGKLDLLIATSVLEEGIDVPACNIVICFDEDINLKSFVQRRGRARQRDSKLILMVSSQSDKLKEWQELELQMKSIYEDEMRTLKELAMLENADEYGGRVLRIASTGAFLNLENAIPRLYHFCSVLPANRYIDRRPEFIIIPNQPARVILPNSVDEKVRQAQGQVSNWTSEKAAKRDAAFEAYVALYNAGLVNDHLMPLLQGEGTLDSEIGSAVAKRPGLVSTWGQLNPWIEVAETWARGVNENEVQGALLTVANSKGDIWCTTEVLLPLSRPQIPPTTLFWESNAELTITFKPLIDKLRASFSFGHAQEYTRSFLSSAFDHRFPIKKHENLVVLFSSVLTADVGNVFRDSEPVISLSQLLNKGPSLGLIRHNKRPYVFEEWLPRKPSASTFKILYRKDSEALEETPHLAVLTLPRRADFLHRIPSGHALSSTRRYAVPVTDCTVDRTPPQLTKVAMLIPSILHRLEIYLVADKLRKTILADVGFQDLNLVATAISASSAQEETNYQRLEFLGDSLLKICTAVQLLAEYPQWHEGYLSAKKDRIVANSRLAKAAMDVGLPKFIITKPFTGRKWTPMYIEELLAKSEAPQRVLSSKVIADVVEALIGAAMIDGGIIKALACMKAFLPEENWQPLEVRRSAIFLRAPQTRPELNERYVQSLEDLVGYTFTNKSLLIESMTHASYTSVTGSLGGSATLERLEFLGDSVLDHLIVRAIYRVVPELPHFKMHLLRSALVNADFLAFICMEWSSVQEFNEIVEEKASQSFKISKSRASVPLWKNMRHTSTKLGSTQLETAERHQDLRFSINTAIMQGSHYPWALLSKLQADKFFSDIVESLLGAIYIDSGSFDSCERVLEGMGILQYLRRIISDSVHVLHPKEELGQLADTKKVVYKVELNRSIVENEESSEYTCQVSVGDEIIIERGGGVSREEIQTKAAEAAVALIRVRQAVQNDS